MKLTRRAVGGLAVGSLAGLAGCSALQGPITFTAKAAVAGDAALSDTGYQQARSKKPTLTRKFASKKVKVTNVLNEYQKEMELSVLGSAKVGIFVAFSTPQVKVAGQGPFNPVGNWSNKELVLKLQSRFENLKNVKKVGSTTMTTLGKEAKVGKFSGTTTYDGKQIDLYLHVTKVKHEDDYVILLGVYPQEKSSEEQNIKKLIKSVTHPA